MGTETLIVYVQKSWESYIKANVCVGAIPTYRVNQHTSVRLNCIHGNAIISYTCTCVPFAHSSFMYIYFHCARVKKQKRMHWCFRYHVDMYTWCTLAFSVSNFCPTVVIQWQRHSRFWHISSMLWPFFLSSSYIYVVWSSKIIYDSIYMQGKGYPNRCTQYFVTLGTYMYVRIANTHH